MTIFKSLIAMVLASMLCSACGGPPTKTTDGPVKQAILIGGVGCPLTSYVASYSGPLRARGYNVIVECASGISWDLAKADVIIGHSMGGLAALNAPPGKRKIFTIDAFLGFSQSCPKDAECVSYYNPADGPFGAVKGATNIDCSNPSNCGGASAIPLIGHILMSGSSVIREDILKRLDE